MERVDEQPATEVDQNNNINHFAALTQALIHTTKTLTTSSSYFPAPPELDYPMIYSGFPNCLFFNSDPQHQQQQQQPYPEADGVGKAAAFNYGTSSSRWPREETMSLLQIRSRLHSSFRQAIHKGPLWDEVSRFMYEEHGYQRSGKKCREKFENLYKYYKKTKEGKSGKQDGKHYRFFRQLEALYGEVDHPTTISSPTHFPLHSNNQVTMASHLLGDTYQHNNMKLPCDQSCLSLSNFTSSSSDDNNKRGQKTKIKEFIDIHMKRLMEQQQLCMEKVMETIEQKEKERVLREEEWKQQAEERLEREHRYWASERAWMKTRDAALMETLQQFTSLSPGRDLASPHIPFSSSSIHPANLKNKKRDECNVRSNPLDLYNNQESKDRWFMGSDHHHHHNHTNAFRFMMSDGNGGSGGSLFWDGTSSFGLKLNNGDENQQN